MRLTEAHLEIIDDGTPMRFQYYYKILEWLQKDQWKIDTN